MVDLRIAVVGNHEPEWGGASRRTLRGRLMQYLPLLGLALAAVGGILGAAYLVGGRDFVAFALTYSRRWSAAWWMVPSVLASYIIALCNRYRHKPAMQMGL